MVMIGYMMNNSELDLSPEEARKAVYKTSVQLIEKLNILIATLETTNIKPDVKFLEETIEQCWSLGEEICSFCSEEDDGNKTAEQWNTMADFLGYG